MFTVNLCRFRMSWQTLWLPAFLILAIFSSTNISLAGQEESIPLDHSAEINWIQMLSQPSHRASNPRPDLLPTGKDGDWQPIIDAVWGPGHTIAEQTALFQNFITTMDREYALYFNRDVDIVGLSGPYLTEMESGVSKGRFQAIMNKMCLALQNGHTSFLDLDVYFTIPEPGVPLLQGLKYMTSTTFGACMTTGDEGIFVYRVVDNHPLGLEVGDVVLGYNGRPWDELYHELLDAELPIGGGGWLTSEASFAYGWDTTVGSNWHLFETIDIQKFSTGETLHLPTILMVNPGVDLSVFCSDQLNEQIDQPTTPDWATWGVLEEGDKRIGFIWCDAWIDDVEAAWGQACLEMVNDPDLDGLIIDFRNNIGGNMMLSNVGLEHLFNTTVTTVDFGRRSNPIVHGMMTRMGGTSFYTITGNPANYFDKPIAVLLGPRAISSGDQVALRMIYHPMVRTFGRPTSASFDSPVEYSLPPLGEFYSRYSKYDAGLANESNTYLSYVGFPVDEEVWLEPADCRDGIDTVIETAIQWIESEATPVFDGPTQGFSRFVDISPNPSNPRTVIKFQIEMPGPCQLDIFDVAGHLVGSRQWLSLNEGLHDYAWNGTLASGQNAASGTYLVRLTAPDKVSGSRFTLVR